MRLLFLNTKYNKEQAILKAFLRLCKFANHFVYSNEKENSYEEKSIHLFALKCS